MPHLRPSSPSLARPRSGRLVALLTALALAGCNWGAPAQPASPTLSVAAPGEASEPLVPVPMIRPNGRGGGDYFTLALPDEASLSKQIVEVSGAPGQMAKRLDKSNATVVTNVIPNVKGFIVEGNGLNKTSIKYFLGATELTVSKRLPSQATIALPKTGGTSGILTIRDGSKELYRGSADAKNVYVGGRVVVRFREGAPRATVETALQKAGIRYYRYPGMNYVVAYHDPEETFANVQKTLLKEPVFDQVTRDTIFTSKATPAPSPTPRQQAVHAQDPLYGGQWALGMIYAAGGWPYTAGHPDVIVAVLDTGVQLNHPDLLRNIYKNTGEIPGNGLDDDGNGRIDDVNGWNSYDQSGVVDDDNGHGTEIAGLIAATADNTGIVGLAYDSRILPCKVSNAEGVATSSSVVDGINYAVRNRASVINMSLASNIDDPAVKEAIRFAQTFNVTVVCAMGNDGNYIKQYPAAWSKELNILAVGATNRADARPTWSTYGEWMTVCAPGEEILTTTKGGGYTVGSGTSHAAGYVSGLAAMIKSLKPGWTPALVRDMIIKSAKDRGAPGFDQYYGWGRITLDTPSLGNLLVELLGEVEVDASSEHQSRLTLAQYAVDKDSESLWSSLRRIEDDQQWLEFDLGKLVRVSSVAALSAPYLSYLFPADFTIELSNDGNAWRQVARERDFEIGVSSWARWNIQPQWARYARFNITKSRINKDNGLYYAQIAEIAFNGEEKAIVPNSSSTYYSNFYPTKLMLDKDPATMWISANRQEMTHEFAIADLGVSRSFRTIKLLSPPRIISEAFPKSMGLYVSNDKVNWRFLKEYKDLVAQPSTWYNFDVPAATARYVRIDVTETNFARGHGSLYGGIQLAGYAAAIAEVEVQ